MNKNNLNRVEIIDHTKDKKAGGGRAFTFWDNRCEIVFDWQDGNRTLKIFINDK